MTLQDWLEQEYEAWIEASKPGGWSSGWTGDEVNIKSPSFGHFRFNPRVLIDSDGQINISLRPIGR